MTPEHLLKGREKWKRGVEKAVPSRVLSYTHLLDVAVVLALQPQSRHDPQGMRRIALSLMEDGLSTQRSKNITTVTIPLFTACITMGATSEPRHSRAREKPTARAISGGMAKNP